MNAYKMWWQCLIVVCPWRNLFLLVAKDTVCFLFLLTNACLGGIIVKQLGHGLVAQLGAHHIRIVGVGSSNLLESTKQVKGESISLGRWIRLCR